MEGITCYQLQLQVRRVCCAISLKAICTRVSSHFRTNIECTHSREVEQLRKRYTLEEKQLIEKFLEAKESFNQKSETLLQEPEEEGLPGKLDMTDSFSH